MEVLAQFDMTILHRPGRKHCNADGLSHIPDELEYCDCCRAGMKLEDLPCKGCPYCTRAQQNWSRSEEQVFDVVPLTVRKIVVDGPNSLSVHVVAQAEDSAHDLPHTPDDHNDLNNTPKPNIDHSDDNDPDDMSISDSASSSGGSDDEETKPVHNQERPWVPIYSNQQLQEFQMNDSDLSLIIQHLDKTEPKQQELFLGSPTLCFYWLKREHLKIKDGVLYYQWKGIPEDRLLLVVPHELKSEVLTHCHDLKLGGHLGHEKTLAKVKQSFFWYQMTQDCVLHVRTCSTCNCNKCGNIRYGQAPLSEYHTGAPLDRIHIDILGPITISYYVYILMLVDQFTKWLECWPLSNQTAEIIVKKVVKDFISHFGVPLKIHSDQGKNFDSSLVKSVCDLLEITKTQTTPYRPSSNGQVERYNCMLLQVI